MEGLVSTRLYTGCASQGADDCIPDTTERGWAALPLCVSVRSETTWQGCLSFDEGEPREGGTPHTGHFLPTHYKI